MASLFLPCHRAIELDFMLSNVGIEPKRFFPLFVQSLQLPDYLRVLPGQVCHFGAVLIQVVQRPVTVSRGLMPALAFRQPGEFYL
jgi:hypothetical protein